MILLQHSQLLIETLKRTTEMNLEQLRAEAIKYDSVYLNNVGHHHHNISLFILSKLNMHFNEKSFIMFIKTELILFLMNDMICYSFQITETR